MTTRGGESRRGGLPRVSGSRTESRDSVVGLAVVVAVAVGAGAPIGGCTGCSGSQAQQKRELQVSFASRLMPPEFRINQPHSGKVRTARVRVYADHDYVALNLRWRERIAEQVAATNAFMLPAFGVKLEVVEFATWQREAPAADLKPMFDELAAKDAGTDVDWVVGIVSPLQFVSTSVHELGMAMPLGRHMVVRGYNDRKERDAYRRALDRLSKAEVTALLDARRRHKQSVVLLHELAHTLGAIHVLDGQWIMNVSYSSDEVGFTEQNEALMRTMLDAWMVSPSDRSETALRKALLAYLSTHDWDGWVEGDKNFLLDFTQNSEAPDNGELGVPAEARAEYVRVRQLLRAGNLDAAGPPLEALVSAYPANGKIRLVACTHALSKVMVALRAAPGDGGDGDGDGGGGGAGGAAAAVRVPDEARAHCVRVGELSPQEIAGEFLLAEAYAATGDIAAAGAILARARERIPGVIDDDAQAAAWGRLFAVYQAMSAVTWTVEALKAAPDSELTQKAATWVEGVRSRYALPPDGRKFKITPEREGDYVGRVSVMIRLIAAQQYPEAVKLAAQGLRLYPNAPGFRAMLCDVHVRKKAWAAARSECKRALAAYADAPWPHYLLGIVELHYRRNAAGIAHLERAIAVDPSMSQPYRALCQAYKRAYKGSKRESAMDNLREAHQRQFGRPPGC